MDFPVLTLPIALKNRPAKDIPLVLATWAFVGVGIMVWPSAPYTGAFTVAFFGLFAVYGTVSLHPRCSYLLLREDGFVFANFFAGSFVPWDRIDAFCVKGRHVCWNYRPEFRGIQALRRVPAFITDVDGVLTDTYGMTAEELCRLMSTVREQSSDREKRTAG